MGVKNMLTVQNLTSLRSLLKGMKCEVVNPLIQMQEVLPFRGNFVLTPAKYSQKRDLQVSSLLSNFGNSAPADTS